MGQLSEGINLKQRISYRADNRPVLPVRIAGPSPQAPFRLRKNYGKRLFCPVFDSVSHLKDTAGRNRDGGDYSFSGIPFRNNCDIDAETACFELSMQHMFSVIFP